MDSITIIIIYYSCRKIRKKVHIINTVNKIKFNRCTKSMCDYWEFVNVLN